MTNKKIVDRVAYCILLSEVCGICLISEGIEQPKLVQNVLLRLQEDDEKDVEIQLLSYLEITLYFYCMVFYS